MWEMRIFCIQWLNISNSTCHTLTTIQTVVAKLSLNLHQNFKTKCVQAKNKTFLPLFFFLKIITIYCYFCSINFKRIFVLFNSQIFCIWKDINSTKRFFVIPLFLLSIEKVAIEKLAKVKEYFLGQSRRRAIRPRHVTFNPL